VNSLAGKDTKKKQTSPSRGGSSEGQATGQSDPSSPDNGKKKHKKK
jgi:hypothetical protein